MDLERELRALPVDWPATPAFRLEPHVHRRRWPLAVAIALAAAAVAFAVPESRGAILRFFDIGTVRIRLVSTLPPAQEKPLTEGLGPAVPPAEVRGRFHQLLVPPLDPMPALHVAGGGFVSVVFDVHGRPVLLSELPNGVYVQKLVGASSTVENVRVRGVRGFWLSGGQHIFFTNRSPRLAGNVLLWAEHDATYRLEGPRLRKEDAIALADSLRRG
jgi:hypothetical protein